MTTEMYPEEIYTIGAVKMMMGVIRDALQDGAVKKALHLSMMEPEDLLAAAQKMMERADRRRRRPRPWLRPATIQAILAWEEAHGCR